MRSAWLCVLLGKNSDTKQASAYQEHPGEAPACMNHLWLGVGEVPRSGRGLSVLWGITERWFAHHPGMRGTSCIDGRAGRSIAHPRWPSLPRRSHAPRSPAQACTPEPRRQTIRSWRGDLLILPGLRASNRRRPAWEARTSPGRLAFKALRFQ